MSYKKKVVESDIFFQKGKGLGWALPGMEELQQKGTKVWPHSACSYLVSVDF